MTRLVRLALVVVIISGVALLVGLLPVLMPARPAQAAPPAHDPTAPTTELSATLHLTASRPIVAVGQTVRLTADLSVEGECSYGVMELKVIEDTNDAPLFAHVDPPDDVIGPGRFPSVWTFRALRPGMAEFAAFALGEGNCDGSWFWHNEGARSGAVQVLDLPYGVWLPAVSQP